MPNFKCKYMAEPSIAARFAALFAAVLVPLAGLFAMVASAQGG